MCPHRPVLALALTWLSACSSNGSAPDLRLDQPPAADLPARPDTARIDARPDAAPPPGWSQRKPASSPSARSVHALVYDPDGKRVLLVGGQPDGPTPIGDLWAWDGQAWTLLQPSGGPLPARKNFGAVYDLARKRLVVFGGIYGGLVVTPTYLGDTWELDGSAWVERKPGGAFPAPRSGHGLAYDAKRGRTVLFGGGDSATSFDDTWEWDGTSWQQLSPGTRPSPRFNVRMVYDPDRQRVVLFGGMSLAGQNLGDLWEWDGQTWSERWPSSKEPIGRGFHALAYDPVRKRVVLYGGAVKWPPYIDPSTTFADQWEWSGTTWTRIADPAGPGKRAGTALAYDEGRKTLVLFGGSDDGTHGKADTWEHR
jgi:hypothetical protein